MDNINQLKREFDYYLKNQEKLVTQYNGKFIVIKDQKILGSYDSTIDAYNETVKEHAPGSFLIQKCSPGKDDYTQTYHSRVIFA